MNLSAPFIQRPIMTTLLMVAILFAGILSYLRLPISNLPNVTYPTITVTTSYPGMTPDVMAHAIALPLEKQLMAIPGATLVSSNNTLGTSSIVIQFNIHKDMTEAAQDVQSAIITATPNLPPNLPYAPTYRKVNPAELPIIYISLTSETLRLNDLYTYANNFIGQRISMLSGVSQVTVFGSPLAIRIQVDPGKLVSNNIALSELAVAIGLGNVNLPTGQLDGLIEAPNVSVDGQLLTAEEWDQLIVAYRNGTPVRIQDLGKTYESFQNDKIHVEYIDKDKSQSTILLAIQKEPNANAVAISDAIYDLLGTLKKELPKAVKLNVFYDRSESIRDSINDVKLTLIIALILVVLVITLYLGKIADTLIPSVVMPMSIIGTFIVMDGYKFTLDNLSLLALTLAVGFIIDDAIVVLENIVRKQEEGENRLQASLEGSKQIGFTIVSMTLSLIAVFLPMLLMGGLLGKILSEFAITLSAVTLISGAISLTLTPMLCSRFLPENNDQSGKLIQFSTKMNKRMRDAYGRMLAKVIDRLYLALFIGFICLGLTALLFYVIPTDFVPDEDAGFFIVYTQAMEAGSSSNMLKYEKQVGDVLRAHPAIDKVIAMSSYSEYRKGQNLIALKPHNQRASAQDVILDLNESLSQIPGIQVFIRNVPLIDLATGQESRGDYQLAMQSIFPDKVYSSAQKLIAAMQKESVFQGVNSDLEINSPQINVSILRDKASTLGITAADIENAFNFSYSYNYITRIDTAIDQYDVILELFDDLQRNTDIFNSLWMRSSVSTNLIPMGAVANWEQGIGASSINHIDQFPSVTINFNLSPGITLEQALDRLQQLQEEFVDPTITVQPIGAIQTYQESLKNAGFLLFIAIFAIYIILGMLYESFVHPITVLTTLPPATLGGLLTLWIFGLPLSMYSYLGIILLIGIVKKNGIMMIDFALDNIRTKGMSPREAIYDASLTRFRPIMMTTAAAIFGALPIALGFGASAAARRPLGLVIIGGLCLSQFITLFITPSLYLVMEKINQKIPWR
jgi:hydrophobic/amphiphilic exporter-1 (mainly G- bacteria), HAE1 family